MQPYHYLTHALDSLRKSIPRLTATDKARAKEFIAVAKTAVCFQLPRDGRLIANDIGLTSMPLDLDGFTRPPFPVAAVEFDITCSDGTAEQVVVVAIDDPEKGGVMCVPSFRGGEPDNQWRPTAFGFLLPYENFGVRAEDGSWHHKVRWYKILPDCVDGLAKQAGFSDVQVYTETLFQEGANHYIFGYLHLCAALWAHEVTFDEVKPDAAKNRMLRARGKTPMFTYKVLTIGKKKRRSRRLGGTHASPRSHMRRGYYRTSKKGVRHWVQSCMVRGEAPGFAHKDYKVEGENS